METEHDREQGPGSRLPNRRVAGEKLAVALKEFGGSETLVLGIPRGGVVVAAEIARLLQADLDAVIIRKLEVPDRPELAMGAVTSKGGLFVNEQTIAAHEVTNEQLETAITRGAADATSRQARYRGSRPAPPIANRPVTVVDDGLATGATMRAALRDVRGAGPSVLVAAVPSGDPEACAELQAFADAVVCLQMPASFSAVSSYYDDFRAPDDETVQHLLQEVPGQDRGPEPSLGSGQSSRC